MIYGSYDIENSKQNVLSFWLFYPSNNSKKQNFGKMKKEPGDIIILHMRTIMTIIWFIVPEIMELCWNMDRDTEIFFVILGYFLPFYPTNNPKNQNFEKTFKKDLTWRYRHFTLACHKWWSYDVWFLRYGTRWTEFFVILDHFLPFYPPHPTPLITWTIKILK